MTPVCLFFETDSLLRQCGPPASFLVGGMHGLGGEAGRSSNGVFQHKPVLVVTAVVAIAAGQTGSVGKKIPPSVYCVGLPSKGNSLLRGGGVAVPTSTTAQHFFFFVVVEWFRQVGCRPIIDLDLAKRGGGLITFLAPPSGRLAAGV